MATEVRPVGLSTWQIDPKHSTAEFAVRHVMVATVKGHISGIDGTIRLDEGDPTRSSVEATLDPSTIDTREPQRDAHLRSSDFLDAERFPTITFRSTRIEPAGDRFQVVGDLTLHGVTREVALDTELVGRHRDPWGSERAGLSAQTVVDRRDYGLTWNQALEAGGVLVGNDVRVTLEVEAVRQDPEP
jgi:polyisoprenoid-binding protein YceI